MTNKEAIDAINANYPPENYTILREALDMAIPLLEEQESVVHPETSCEITYITNCCCDLCGMQLIREDNFCRGCGKHIEWKGQWSGNENNSIMETQYANS